ncbi:MAG: uracil-DNA glycosylase [Rhodospirillales bacterium]
MSITSKAQIDPRLKGPAPDCALCPRLAAFRADNRKAYPDFFNGPVPSFGPGAGGDARAEKNAAPWLLIAGMAPGLKGANATGRPFTGDGAGNLLYPALLRHGLAEGVYDRRPDDGLTLAGCRIVNAVRCVPPQNKPIGAEVAACRPFLADEIAALRDGGLQVILCLGGLAHGAVLAALGLKKSAYAFSHGAAYTLEDGLIVADSYHCSRYNTNTGRLTEAMFDAVLADLIKRRED